MRSVIGPFNRWIARPESLQPGDRFIEDVKRDCFKLPVVPGEKLFA